MPRTLIHSLRGAEVDALLPAACQGSLGERDAALITFVLDTGVRVSEVASLRIGDVDFENAVCRVGGKGSKERRVPVGRLARRELRRYLARRRRPPADAPLFMAEHGEPLTRWGIQKIVRRLAQRAGLQTRCSPHVLRHTFARAFLTNGGDVFALQRILGHSPASLDITQRLCRVAGRGPARGASSSVADGPLAEPLNDDVLRRNKDILARVTHPAFQASRSVRCAITSGVRSSAGLVMRSLLYRACFLLLSVPEVRSQPSVRAQRWIRSGFWCRHLAGAEPEMTASRTRLTAPALAPSPQALAPS